MCLSPRQVVRQGRGWFNHAFSLRGDVSLLFCGETLQRPLAREDVVRECEHLEKPVGVKQNEGKPKLAGCAQGLPALPASGSGRSPCFRPILRV